MYESNEQYQATLELWKISKEKEKYFNQMRLEAEEELLEITKAQLKESGVNNFDGGLKITTGLDQKWDNESLFAAKLEFDAVGYVFPFEITWKPNNEAIKYTKKYNEDLYKEFLEPALTIKSKKPSFSMKE